MASRKRTPNKSSVPAKHVQTNEERTPVTMTGSPLTRFMPFLLPALLVLLTIAAYAQVFSCGFIEAYDDETYVTNNAVVLQGITWHGLKWSLTSFVTGNWHPLTWWSHMADVTLYGLNPVGHHATNLALHCINIILLYTFFLKTTGFRGKSFMVAALFAIHPLHVESVAWIAERKDLLSTATGLLALHLYTHYVRTRQKRFYLAMFTLLCLSLMAKPMLVTFPLLLLVLDYWPLTRFRECSFYTLVREKIPLFAPVLVLSTLTLVAQKSVGAIVDRSFHSRMYSALDAYCVYLRKLFAPFDLASFYPYLPISLTRALLAVLFLTTISLGCWYYRQRNPWLLTGWLWFLGLLVPVIGIISVGTQAYADRYSYLPAIGIAIMVVWSADGLATKAGLPSWVRTTAAAMFIVACSLLTWQQVGYWKDGFSLYGRELAVVAGNWHAHFNLGSMLVDRKRFDEGITHYQEALLNKPPSEANIQHNLGVAFERKGDKTLALKHFRKSIQLSPGLDKGYLGLARIMSSTGDMAGALSIIKEGLTKVPDNSLLLAKEAYLLHSMGDLTAAVDAYRQAIAKEPYFVQNYINLGILLMQQGNNADFTTLVDQLRRIDPNAADNLTTSRK